MGEYIEKDFVFSKKCSSTVQVDCYHNCSPGREFFVEEIVRRISKKVGSSSVFAKFSRLDIDLNKKIDKKNKSAILEYQKILSDNFFSRDNFEKKYLLVVLHGMKNREEKDIEIGTLDGSLASDEVRNWFVSRIKKEFSGFRVAVDEEFKGGEILSEYRSGGEFFDGLGESFNVFQVEISRELREEFKDKVIDSISKILLQFDKASHLS